MEKNRQSPAVAKATERYLLATKLFCEMCGKMTVGESGTGTGEKIANCRAMICAFYT